MTELEKSAYSNLKSNSIFGYIVITLLIVIAYSQTIGFQYTGDDVLVTKDNHFVQRGISGIPKIFSHSYLFGYSNTPDPIYRPVPLATYAIESHLFGFKPKTFHAFQILWYIISCIVFLKVLYLSGIGKQTSLLIICLFAVHPTHVEVVANIKSKDELLAFFGIAASLYCAIKNRTSGKSIFAVLSGVFCLFALLSKESSIGLFLVVPLWVWIVFKDTQPKYFLQSAIPLFVSLILYFSIRTQVNLEFGNLDVTQNSLALLPDFLSRLPSAVVILQNYIIKSIFPYPLSYDYSFNQIPLVHQLDSRFWIALSIVLLSFFGIFYLYKKSKFFEAMSIIWFLIFIAPTSNFFFLIGSTFAERFLFTPVLGVCILFIFLMESFYKKYTAIKSYPTYITYPIIGIFLYYSYIQTAIWKNDQSLFKSGIQSAPHSVRTNMFFGKYWYNLSKEQTNEQKKNAYLDSALKYYNQSLYILPKQSTCNQFAGWVYREKGQTAQEKNSYVAAYQADSTYFPALISLAVFYLKQDNYESALDALSHAQKLNPKVYDIEYNLGYTYRALNRFDEAIKSLLTAHVINPSREEPLNLLVKIYRDNLHKTDSALIYNEKLKLFNREH